MFKKQYITSSFYQTILFYIGDTSRFAPFDNAKISSIPFYNLLYDTVFLMESALSFDKNASSLSYTEIEPSEKFGPGKLYRVGVIEVEIYECLPDEKPSLARIRAPGASLALSFVADVRPSDGGMLIDFGRKGERVHASLSINSAGDIAFIYSPPPPPMGISQNGKIRKVGRYGTNPVNH